MQVVQTFNSGASFATSATMSATTAGNTIVVCVTDYNAGASMYPLSSPTIGTSPGVTWPGTTLLQFSQSPDVSSQSVGEAIWLIPNIPSGITNIQCGNFVNGNFASIAGCEVSGLGNAPLLDGVVANGSGNSSSLASGNTGATSAPSGFVFGCSVGYALQTNEPSAPWVNLGSMGNTYTTAGYQLSAAASSTFDYTTTSTGGGNAVWAAGCVVIKPNNVKWQVLQSAVAPCHIGTAIEANPVTLASNCSSGSTLIAYVQVNVSGSNSITSVKDDLGNSFTRLTDFEQSAGTNAELAIYILATPTADVGRKPTITVTTNHVNTLAGGILVQEVSGIMAGTDGSPSDLTGTAAGSVGSLGYTSTLTEEFLVSYYCDIESSTFFATPPLDGVMNRRASIAQAVVAIK